MKQNSRMMPMQKRNQTEARKSVLTNAVVISRHKDCLLQGVCSRPPVKLSGGIEISVSLISLPMSA